MEVAQQQGERLGLGHHVGVDERHVRRADPGEPGVARPGGAHVAVERDQLGAVPPGHLRDRLRVCGGVVHHDHADLAAERGEQPVELLRPVVHRHDHGELGEVDRRQLGHHRVGHAHGEQPVGEPLGGGVGHLEAAAAQHRPGPFAEVGDARRHAPGERAAPVEDAHPAPQLDDEPLGQPVAHRGAG